MNPYTYRCCLAEHMHRFVDLRQWAGKDYCGQARNLSYFDRFLSQERWTRRWITQQIINRYRLSLTDLSTATQRCRMPVVRQFCIYLSAYQPRCYVPVKGEWTLHASPQRLPFIFTTEQVGRLVRAARKLSPYPFELRPHVYAMFIGLIYVTGMRISEAMCLDVGDVDLPRRRIFVRKGKFSKQRWLPLAGSTTSKLYDYLHLRERRSGSVHPNAPLFVSLEGRLPKGSVEHNFRNLVRACDIGRRGRDHPTPHSLRHSYACHCLLKWYRQGVDINARLPVLATYMGHADLRFTYRYLHAIPELLDEANRRFLTHYREIINPEDTHE
jgi:integrase